MVNYSWYLLKVSEGSIPGTDYIFGTLEYNLCGLGNDTVNLENIFTWFCKFIIYKKIKEHVYL